MPACHAGGHEFESRTHRKTEKEVNTIDECSLFLYEHNETETLFNDSVTNYKSFLYFCLP